jgi:hypothetical protein
MTSLVPRTTGFPRSWIALTRDDPPLSVRSSYLLHARHISVVQGRFGPGIYDF